MASGLIRSFVLRDATHLKQLGSFLRSNWLAMAQAGKPLAVTVTEAKSKRSDDQNRKLHALIRDIAETAWVDGEQYSPEAWKEEIRRRFIGTEEIELPGGTVVERGISTTTLSVQDFSDLIEQVQQWAITELGVECV